MSTTSSTTTRRCIQFSLEEIKAATNQFSTKILGQGGEAVVYFAEIYIDSINKTPVAVKKLKDLKEKRDNYKEFQNEIEILSKIDQHPNIVSLIGYCDESDHKILVYEYMENGSLSGLLKNKNPPNALTWLQRLNICLDVARGLKHFHTQTHDNSKGIIHRDMKPGNILVCEKWVGKVSDFGLLKLSTADQEISTMATAHKGTSGYFAPEYSSLGRVTRKIDVFSFGVVLFYVLCEKSPWDRDDESYYLTEEENLGNWALKNIDAKIRREISGESLTLFTDIVRRSLQLNPGKRPTMDNVVLELEKVLECHESENLAKELDTDEEAYLQANPGEGLPSEDQTFQESENSSNEHDDTDEETYFQANPGEQPPNEYENLPKQLDGSPRNGGCSQISLEEIKAATNQFSHIIGAGGEGKVYLARIYIGSNNIPLAVKVLKDKYSEGFEKEIRTMSKIQHPNIVSLLGYCNESGQKILVYEYMAKGCLSNYLKEGSHVSLSWLQRLNICLGAARGLQHLHSQYHKGIIHHNVNPNNILMDEDWVAKLSDSGLFKMSKAGQETSMMYPNLKGTSGYHAPEYMMLGRVTRKTDVYSFGVVLFQVLCRKLPWDREDDSYFMDENEDLGSWAHENVDAQIRGEMLEESLGLFTDIIGRSLQTNPGKRPTMDEVVLDLEKAIKCQEKLFATKERPSPLSTAPVSPIMIFHPNSDVLGDVSPNVGTNVSTSPPSFSMAHPLALQVRALDAEILGAEAHLMSLRNIRASIYTIMMDTFGQKEGDHETTESEGATIDNLLGC